jgi:hypothetical protein
VNHTTETIATVDMSLTPFRRLFVEGRLLYSLVNALNC